MISRRRDDIGRPSSDDDFLHMDLPVGSKIIGFAHYLCMSLKT